MELESYPSIYDPKYIAELNLYIECIPDTSFSFNRKYPYGLECCSGHIFYNRNSFVVHIKSKGHINWLNNKNTNLYISGLEKKVNFK